MKPPLAARVRRWLCAAVAALGLAAPVPVHAVIEPAQAEMLTSPQDMPPGPGAAWRTVPLPDIWRQARPRVAPADTWYRLQFEYPPDSPRGDPWALYLPYLSDGGEVWLNGTLAGRIRESTPQVHIRWARPHLLALPSTLLHPGLNELAVHAALPRRGAAVGFPRAGIGPYADLLPVYERRFFWVNSTAQITAVVCLMVSAFVLFIWWRRPTEVLYGLFGLAAGLWGVRTLTFVIEVVPLDLWLIWRIAYLGATGGFIVAMTVLALRFAGIRRPWAERGLFAYWLLGPLWLAAGGTAAEPLVNRYWIAGFLPIGISIMGFSLWSVWKQRTLESAVMPAAMVLAVLAGLHDYVVNWSFGGLAQWLLPGWADHRIFLLHHGANLVLVAMGGLLSARFIRALSSLESLNQTLESRVADRERELSANYARMAALQQQHAAAQERQLIMREIHDGLGSQLFVSLSRVERGDMQVPQIADSLRACIADMRLALDTYTPDDNDFRATLGNFLFRWQGQLTAAGVHSAWTIEVPEDELDITPQAALQLLRIAQEALTNVLKHARATRVDIRLRASGDQLQLQVQDNGCGPAGAAAASGRGLGNMQSRAQRLGGGLEVSSAPGGGTCVALQVPMKAVRV